MLQMGRAFPWSGDTNLFPLWRKLSTRSIMPLGSVKTKETPAATLLLPG